MRKWLHVGFIFLLSFSIVISIGQAKAADKNGYRDFKTKIEQHKHRSSEFEKQEMDLQKIKPLQDHLKAEKMKEDQFRPMAELYEQEPNDTIELADIMMLDDYMFGTFSWQDVDLFRLEIERGGLLRIYGASESDVNLGYLLFDLYGNPLTPIYEDFYEGAMVQIYDVTPATYIIAAIDLNGGGTSGLYGLLATMDMNPSKEVHRISGTDRYNTAVEISKTGWAEGTDHVVLAKGTEFPDALAGAPLAYQLDAPILLTPQNLLNTDIKEEISRLGATKVTILGGTGAISEKVEKYLKGSMGLTVKRIGGKDRYETAANIAKELDSYNTAVIAYGGDFPDALSIAPYAAINGIPILLTEKNKVPPVTTTSLEGVESTIIVGGTGVISGAVEKEVPEPHRITGKNRYETSVNIVRDLNLPTDFMTLATGASFADALTGSVLAAKFYEPIVLVQPNQVPTSVKALISERGTFYFTVLGGKGAISDTVIDQLTQ